MASFSERKERSISSSWPLRPATTPAGKVCRSMAARTSAATAPMSRPEMSPEMIAARFWPTRRISLGPWASFTSATLFR